MSKRRAYLCLVLATVLSSVSYAVTADRITSAIDASHVVALGGNRSSLAARLNDQGPVDPALKLNSITLVIAPSPTQQAALNKLLVAQQNPKSPLYHKWLTPAQYADQFGLSPNDVKRITSWLQAQGFVVQRIGGGRNSITVSGTAALVESTFQTEIHNYTTINSEKHYANATPLMLPAALSGVVTAIHGVSSFRMKPMISHRPRGQYTFNASEGQYYMAPGDVATVYDINPLYNASPAIDGTGQKLAIVGETDIYLADITDFRSAFGLPAITGCTLTTSGNIGLVTACNTTNFQYVLIGSDPLEANSIQDDLEEADLDVEWSGATARNAQIVYVNAPDPSGDGVYDSLQVAINPPNGPPLAPVISMSYGYCEELWFSPEVRGFSLESELNQAALEGVTVMNSSDDQASAGCDGGPPNSTNPFQGAQYGLSVSYPASSPWVTAVGGTSYPLTVFENGSSYWSSTNGSFEGSALTTLIGQEQAWNDDAAFALYCQQFYTESTFCTQGGSPAVSGWVPLEASATAEQVQEDIWIDGGGGGASNCFNENAEGICTGGLPQPSWQSTLSVTGAPAGVRWVPDVSLLASPNFPGYIFCTELSELDDPGSGSSCAGGSPITSAIDANSIIGGTSASSPIFAGMVTLLNQYLGSSGLGAINQQLYSLAATSPSAFHHVPSGNNNVYCQAGKPAGQPASVICPSSGVIGFSASNADSATGYNLVTGLGSVDVNLLAEAWQASLSNFSVTAGSLSPTSVSASNSATVTVTVAPTAGTPGTVTFSCPNLPQGIKCSFNPVSVANGTGTTTLTINTQPYAAAATDSITVLGTSGGSSSSTTVSLTVTATTETFTLTPQSTSIQAAAGSLPAPTVNLTVGGTLNLTTTPLSYTCTTTAPESTCNPPTYGPSNSSGVSFQITTTAPSAAANHPANLGVRIFYAALLPGLLGIMFTARSRKRSLRGMRFLGLIVVLGFSTLWMASCSGSNNSSTGNQGTPPGQYAITINATTGGPAALSQQVTVSLTVTSGASK